jgi:hypothetical protein
MGIAFHRSAPKPGMFEAKGPCKPQNRRMLYPIDRHFEPNPPAVLVFPDNKRRQAPSKLSRSRIKAASNMMTAGIRRVRCSETECDEAVFGFLVQYPECHSRNLTCDIKSFKNQLESRPQESYSPMKNALQERTKTNFISCC